MVIRNCAVITATARNSGILANSGNSPASRPLLSPNGNEMSAAAVTMFHTQASGTPNCGHGTRTPQRRGTR